ncbi:fibronectin type III domain-containing protein [Solibacillus silvestris]
MEKLPLWLKEGIEPSLNEKNVGWSPGSRPPAQFLNWYMNKTYLALKEHFDHQQKSIDSETGAHDFKYADGKVYGLVNGEWVDIFHEEVIVVPEPEPEPEPDPEPNPSEPVPIPPKPVEIVNPIRGLTMTATSRTATVTWTNPADENFYAVIVRYKEGTSMPTSLTDGIMAYEGSSTSITVHNLKPETWYSFRIFTISKSGKVNDDQAYQTIRGKTLREIAIYGVRIDTTNSNPETAVTYIEDAVSSTPARGNNGAFDYGSWKDRFPFNQIKPCLMKGEEVLGYLDPNDFTKFVDGTSAKQTTKINYFKPLYPHELNGHIMIEFPTIYWKIESLGNYTYVRYSDKQYDSTYKALAHTRGTSVRNKLYLAAFIASAQPMLNETEMREKRELWSATGDIAPIVKGLTMNEARTMVWRNGPSYDLMGFHQLTMLQVLFLVMFKNRDSQSALGKGYTGLTFTHQAGSAAGSTLKKGMFYGSNSYLEQVKFCGMEDLWGNYEERIDGLYVNYIGRLMIGTKNFNDNGVNYTDYGKIEKGGYYPKDVQGTTEKGFIPNISGGSSTTHYTDYGGVNKYEASAVFGGHFYDRDAAGLFNIDISLAPHEVVAGPTFGAVRIMSLQDEVVEHG